MAKNIEAIEDYCIKTDKIKKTTNFISKVGIIGAGIVGRNIARMISRNGLEVVLIELSEERIQRAFKGIEEDLDNMIERWGMTNSEKRAILSRISGTTECNKLSDCEFVIEAVKSKRRHEVIKDRKEIFKKIEQKVSPETIIATNSTTQVITELSNELKYPERCISLHFVSMEPDSKMVEIIRGFYTSDRTFEQAKRLARLLQKEVITVKEYPGVISTRLFVPLINEACSMLMQDIGTMEDIDKTLRIGFGARLGPFEMADKIGLDKVLRWAENLYEEFGDLKYKASPLIKKLVRSNQIGRRNKHGFYIYNDNFNTKTPNILTK